MATLRAVTVNAPHGVLRILHRDMDLGAEVLTAMLMASLKKSSTAKNVDASILAPYR